MKKINLVFLFIITLSLGDVAATSFMKLPTGHSAPELKIRVSTQVTVNGCKFQVEGWIDVTIHTLFGVQLNSYDLYATGLPPCGNYHLQGLTSNPRGSDDFDPSTVNTEPLIIGILNKEIK